MTHNTVHPQQAHHHQPPLMSPKSPDRPATLHEPQPSKPDELLAVTPGTPAGGARGHLETGRTRVWLTLDARAKVKATAERALEVACSTIAHPGATCGRAIPLAGNRKHPDLGNCWSSGRGRGREGEGRRGESQGGGAARCRPRGPALPSSLPTGATGTRSDHLPSPGWPTPSHPPM